MSGCSPSNEKSMSECAANPADGVSRLYTVFERYRTPAAKFCGHCYNDVEADYFKTTPLQNIDLKHGQTLLWETYDHWENSEVYRHYLPRLLELMGPPSWLDDMYPLHLFETLRGLKFETWPREERQAVIDYLAALPPHPEFTAECCEEWGTGLKSLRV